MITTLLSACHQERNRLNVLDFGGSLGSSYFHNRGFLETVSDFNWSTIEQPQFVAAGRAHLASNELHFFEKIEDCARHFRPNLIVLSGVLQYLPDPWDKLQTLRHIGSLNTFDARTALAVATSDGL